MKKVLYILFVLIVLSFIVFQLQQYVSAVTLGNEPPAEYINKLKTCTPGTVKAQKGAMITEYSVKGMLPNGRCNVTITSYSDFSNKEDYEQAKELFGGFVDMFESMSKNAGKAFDRSKIPSADEVLKMAENEKDVLNCKFSKSERDALVTAWAKHDDKNPPPQKIDGGYSYSWDSSKMSSYDALMIEVSQGPCETLSTGADNDSKNWKKFACEYADTTCYIRISSNNSAAMHCTKDAPQGVSMLDFISTVKKHAQSGMCSQL